MYLVFTVACSDGIGTGDQRAPLQLFSSRSLPPGHKTYFLNCISYLYFSGAWHHCSCRPLAHFHYGTNQLADAPAFYNFQRTQNIILGSLPNYSKIRSHILDSLCNKDHSYFSWQADQLISREEVSKELTPAALSITTLI